MAAPAAPPLVCSRCRKQRYTSQAEHIQQWGVHKHECVPWDEQPRDGELRLQHLMDPLGIRRLFGPYRDDSKSSWQRPLGEPAMLTTMCEITLPTKVVPSYGRVDARFAQTHKLLGVGYSDKMTAVYTRIWEQYDCHVGRVKKTPSLVMPDHLNLTPELYWQWFASGKCEVYVMAMVWAVESLTLKKPVKSGEEEEDGDEDEGEERHGFGVPFRFRGEDVIEWGSAPVCYTKSFIPVARTFAHDSGTPTDMDQLTDGCAHVVFYFQTKSHVVYIDLSPAQYGAPKSLDKTNVYPFLVCIGDEELRKAGFVPHPTNKRQANTDPDTVEAFNIKMWSCPPHYAEGVRSMAGSIFHHLATCLGVDIQGQGVDYPRMLHTKGYHMASHLFVA